MNKNLFKSVVIANGDTFMTLADYLGITLSTLSKKVNEKNKAGFNQPEIMMIKDRYSLSAEDIDNIFFDSKVS